MRIMRLASESLTSHEFLYMVIRIAADLDEPFKSFVQAKLRVLARMRGISYPSREKPFISVYLRHEEFPLELSLWVQELIKKAGGIPYHRPKGAVVERKGRTIAQRLFNSKDFMRSFEYSKQPRCTCKELAARLPDRAVTARGHVASHAQDLEEACILSPT